MGPHGGLSEKKSVKCLLNINYVKPSSQKTYVIFYLLLKPVGFICILPRNRKLIFINIHIIIL